MDGDSMANIMGPVYSIAGSIIRVLGSKWIADSTMKRQEMERVQSHVQDQLGAYTKLWRFLRESNNRATNHPSFKKIEWCTHVFDVPGDYRWLRDHFILTGNLLSDKTYSLYLESYSKDELGIDAMADPTPKSIPANYMTLQDEAREMCDKLEGMLGKPTKRIL